MSGNELYPSRHLRYGENSGRFISFTVLIRTVGCVLGTIPSITLKR